MKQKTARENSLPFCIKAWLISPQAAVRAAIVAQWRNHKLFTVISRAFMAASNHLTIITVVCLLSASSLSGCGYIGGIIEKTLFSATQEEVDYSNYCKRRCADKTGKEYDDCLALCKSPKEERDKQSQADRDRIEMEKRVNDTVLKSR
jgi:hypothetical protein